MKLISISTKTLSVALSLPSHPQQIGNYTTSPLPPHTHTHITHGLLTPGREPTALYTMETPSFYIFNIIVTIYHISLLMTVNKFNIYIFTSWLYSRCKIKHRLYYLLRYVFPGTRYTRGKVLSYNPELHKNGNIPLNLIQWADLVLRRWWWFKDCSSHWPSK